MDFIDDKNSFVSMLLFAAHELLDKLESISAIFDFCIPRNLPISFQGSSDMISYFSSKLASHLMCHMFCKTGGGQPSRLGDDYIIACLIEELRNSSRFSCSCFC